MSFQTIFTPLNTLIVIIVGGTLYYLINSIQINEIRRDTERKREWREFRYSDIKKEKK